MTVRHKVNPGECVLSIAAKHGFTDWRFVYEHADNDELRDSRHDPNVLHPGDELQIPEHRSHYEACVTEKLHRFRRPGLQCRLRIIVKDEEETPLADADYELVIGEYKIQGKTDGNGVVDQTLAPTEREGHLTVWPTNEPEGERFCWDLKLGHLNPLEEITGLQARLNNLGYHCGRVDGDFGPATKVALRSFQHAHDLPITGEPDDETKQRLFEQHANT